MKFFEFGTENKITILWLCGYGGCWKPALLPFIEEAQKSFHIIVDAYDGFNPDEPETVFHSITDEAQKACDYIVNELNGVIDIIYGVSLGGMVANEMLLDPRIRFNTLIADGYTIMKLANLKTDFMKRIYYSFYATLEYALLHNHLNILAKFLNRDLESLKRAVYMNAKKASFYNCESSLNGYKYKYHTFNKVNSHIWHADSEKTAIKRVLKLRKKAINFQHKIFHNVGHGGLATSNPQLIVAEIQKAYNLTNSCLPKSRVEK